MTASSKTYLWWGKDRQGCWTRGRQAAASSQALKHTLMLQKIRVCAHVLLPPGLDLKLGWSKRRMCAHDVTLLSRQLATLLQAGLPLLQSLQLMMQGAERQPSGQLARFLSQRIETGETLSQAMRTHGLFDDIFCHLIAAAESSGQLDRMLEHLAAHREKSEALSRRLRSALIYPGIISLVGCVVSALLLTFVVPAFEQIFNSVGGDLPALTQFVLNLSRWLNAYGPWLVLLIAGLFVAVRHGIQNTEPGQRAWDVCRLRLPLLRSLTQHALSARWCRTLATLLQAGVPIDDALLQLQQVLDHRHYRLATQVIHSQVTQGWAVSKGLHEYPDLFDSMLIQMCRVGEESGTLDAMLARMADHHEQAVDTLTQRLTTLLEPSIMVILGLTMGTLMLAMYWPIFQIGQVL